MCVASPFARAKAVALATTQVRENVINDDALLFASSCLRGVVRLPIESCINNRRVEQTAAFAFATTAPRSVYLRPPFR